MPELRGLTATEVIRAFQRTGGKLRRGKGSHVNIKMPNGVIVTIPGHGEVKIGLLKAAIKKAGLTDDEFSRFLKE